MFFIIAVIAFIVAVIALIVYLVQMNRTKEQYLGKDAVDKIARQAAEKSRKKDVALTCDYCGCKIDTTIHKVCPHCGAPYAKDPEWINRHKVDKDALNQKIDHGINRNKATVKRLNEGRMNRVKILVICISAFIICVAAIVVFAVTDMHKNDNRSDELPADYVKTGYQFTEPLLADDANLKIELGEIYQRHESFYGTERYDYMFEVKVTNKTGKEGLLDMDIAAANGKCIFSSLYERISTKDELTKLMEIRNYYLGEEYLKTLVVDSLTFRDKDYEPFYAQTGFRTLETTADYEPAEKKPKGEVLLEKNGMVFSVYDDPEKEDVKYLQITNTGEYDYSLRTYASLVNGQPDKLWIDYVIPVGCQAETDYLNKIYLSDNEAAETIRIQFECKCEEHPEQNFVTEYLDLPLAEDDTV